MQWSYKIDGNLRDCHKPDATSLSWIFIKADDIALVAESERDLQQALRVVDTFGQWEMEISVHKTQVKRLSSTASTFPEDSIIGPTFFHLRGHALEEVDRFKYPGSISSANMSMQPETASRLSRAAGAYR